MKITVRREIFTNKSTIGQMYFDNEWLAYTLEDTSRRQKIDKKTAIPSGTYEIIIDFSNRFQKMMPHILNVPGFNGIRIHSGNTDADTEGCILIGKKRAADFVSECKPAVEELFSRLEAALKLGKVYIDIIGGSNYVATS